MYRPPRTIYEDEEDEEDWPGAGGRLRAPNRGHVYSRCGDGRSRTPRPKHPRPSQRPEWPGGARAAGPRFGDHLQVLTDKFTAHSTTGTTAGLRGDLGGARLHPTAQPVHRAGSRAPRRSWDTRLARGRRGGGEGRATRHSTLRLSRDTGLARGALRHSRHTGLARGGRRGREELGQATPSHGAADEEEKCRGDKKEKCKR